MKHLLTILLCLIAFTACKNNTGDSTNADPESKVQTLTIGQKIANAHGFQQWQNVKQFEFKFGGKIESPESGRSWQWNPKTNAVTLMTTQDTITYNRKDMDSLAINTDRAFINDKFWALIPFQLVWDKGLNIADPQDAEAPISKQVLSKVTITYANEGGYTPGDAYDLYVDDTFMIREWSFRRGNAAEPTLSNTFENYSDYNGIKVAQDHKFGEGDRNLLIRNVKVILEE